MYGTQKSRRPKILFMFRLQPLFLKLLFSPWTSSHLHCIPSHSISWSIRITWYSHSLSFDLHIHSQLIIVDSWRLRALISSSKQPQLWQSSSFQKKLCLLQNRVIISLAGLLSIRWSKSQILVHSHFSLLRTPGSDYFQQTASALTFLLFPKKLPLLQNRVIISLAGPSTDFTKFTFTLIFRCWEFRALISSSSSKQPQFWPSSSTSKAEEVILLAGSSSISWSINLNYKIHIHSHLFIAENSELWFPPASSLSSSTSKPGVVISLAGPDPILGWRLTLNPFHFYIIYNVDPCEEETCKEFVKDQFVGKRRQM